MTAAPTFLAELPAPSPAPGSPRCPRALPHQCDVPGADWQHSHSLKPSRAAGLNSRSRSSQTPARLVSRHRLALGSSQMAGEPRPPPLGWGVGPNSFWAVVCPFPSQETLTPLSRAIPKPQDEAGSLWLSRTGEQDPDTLGPGPTRSDWLVPSQHYRLCPLPPGPTEKGGLENSEGAVKHQRAPSAL